MIRHVGNTDEHLADALTIHNNEFTMFVIKARPSNKYIFILIKAPEF